MTNLIPSFIGSLFDRNCNDEMEIKSTSPVINILYCVSGNPQSNLPKNIPIVKYANHGKIEFQPL